MNKDNSLAFFAAGILGGVALGMAFGPRSPKTLRQRVIDKSREGIREGIDELSELADTASAAFVRQQDAVRKAFEAGRKSYLKNAG
jgi:hypothetical protein